MRKRKLLILSHVLPFPRNAGQQQRVFYTIRAARERFHTTFAGPVPRADARHTRARLLDECDDVIAMPSVYGRNMASKFWHRGASALYSVGTGLRRSNYILGHVELHPSRIRHMLEGRSFDCVLFEYWHGAASTAVFRERGIPTVLDMHDVLWQSYSRILNARRRVPESWKRWAVGRYKTAEEHAWNLFDALIAINREEERYVKSKLPSHVPVLHAAMGTDLALWPYSASPADPPRIAYYGGLGSPHNQESALRCVTHIAPLIWRRHPNAEFWLVGSNPSRRLTELTRDPRVKVPGYVQDVQSILRTMTAVICPWSGRYGFRSRLIEVMALGVPIVVSPDATYGMELNEGAGVLFGRDDAELATHAIHLLGHRDFAIEQGRLARAQVERSFSVENTYGRLMAELDDWLSKSEPKVAVG
jgi:glycosyltransferase involved in cell wall biosynthesis